jgi:hypothetical protein
MHWPRTDPNSCGTLLRCLCGLLLAAVALKVLNPTTTNTLWPTILVIQWELLLVVLLASDFSPRLVWLVTLLSFGLFGAFALFRVIGGYDSCGCFGSVKVHPWWTFMVDIGVVLLLWFKRRALQERQGMSVFCHHAACGAAYIILSVLSLTAIARYAPEPLSAGVSATDDGRVIILEPAAWIGNEFPIRDDLSPGVDLSVGQWTVLIYHHDCEECQQALPQYERLAAQIAGDRSDLHVLCLEAPPFGEPLDATSAAKHARLADDREWFVEAPVEIQVSDGIVTLASTDLPSLIQFP